MEHKLIRESRETEQTVLIKPIQTIVEAEAPLPGSLRDEARVYHADATIGLNGGELSGNKVIADGRAVFHVLFAQGELDKIMPLEVSADFSQPLSMQREMGDVTNAQVHLYGEVQNVSAKVFNGRIMLRAVVGLQGDVTAHKSINLVVGVNGCEDVQVKTQTVAVQRVVGEGEVQSTIRDEVELTELMQVRDTLLASAYAVVEDVKVTGSGNAHVIGTIILDACHTSDMPQRPLINTTHKIPYEQEIALSGAVGNMLAAQTRVKDVAVLSQNGEGEQADKIMRCEVVLHSSVHALESEETALLKDAYTIKGENIRTTAEKISMCTQIVQEEVAESGRMTVLLPDGSPRIKQPLLAFARPIVLKKQKIGSKLHIDGMMNVTVIYLTDDTSVPVSVATDAQFSSIFATDAQPEDFVRLFVTEPAVSAVTGDRVELKYILRMAANGTRACEINAVVDAQPFNDENESGGLSICFVQPGEELWDIGKRYRLPVVEIVAQNQMKEERVSAGDALLIYRHTSSNEQKTNA